MYLAKPALSPTIGKNIGRKKVVIYSITVLRAGLQVSAIYPNI
jgi:hypothetical protein